MINELRLLAEDLHSLSGTNKYSTAMSKAADEIEGAYAALDKIERLQAENAELKRDAAIGAVVWNFIDRMNDVAPECGDSAERILAEFVAAVMPEFNSAMER